MQHSNLQWRHGRIGIYLSNNVRRKSPTSSRPVSFPAPYRIRLRCQVALSRRQINRTAYQNAPRMVFMTLNFAYPSRSYDENKHRARRDS